MRKIFKAFIPAVIMLLSACSAQSEASVTESVTETEGITETEDVTESESVTEAESVIETESISETEIITKTETVSESASERMENDTRDYRTDIVLITEYRNWAWGYQHSGNVIDMSGNVYSYDFSTGTYGGEEIDSDEEFISALMEICSEGEPDAFDSSVTDTLKKIRELADGADRKAKMISESAACDAGQHIIYAVTSDYKLVTICSDGDSIITSTDENALEIQRLCNEMGIH